MEFVMRRARPDDVAAVAAVIRARSAWMEQAGMPSWREAADNLAGQAAAPGTGMWLLTAAGNVVGCTTVITDKPRWGWTEQEAGEDALYLFTTCTDPAWRAAKPGTLIARWAVDHAAAERKAWVRRGCLFPGLVRYYRAQGFDLIREVQRTHARVSLMARRAEPLPDVPATAP